MIRTLALLGALACAVAPEVTHAADGSAQHE
jgi:hypothetical protein